MIAANTLNDLFDKRSLVFSVPQYQRAYAWERTPHLETFLSDLRNQPPNKQYFFGSFLLEEAGGYSTEEGTTKVNIVDGQQRLTTLIIFVSCAIKHLQSSPDAAISDKALSGISEKYLVDRGTARFHTITEDDNFFADYIRSGNLRPTRDFDTPSQRRLWEAKEFFESRLTALQEKELIQLLNVLENAKVLVYSVNSPEDATQIFELQNDRGKALTRLEALKSFLMHNVYLHADKNHTEDTLTIIQQYFSKIFRICEKLEEQQADLDEDSVLQYHCVAFEEWENSGDYENAKDFVKKTVWTRSRDANHVVEWIKGFSLRLQQSFEIVLELLDSRSTIAPLADLFSLERVASFYPLLIKTYSYDPGGDRFARAARLMEQFAFRGAIGNFRSDTGRSKFYRIAWEFDGRFDDLYTELIETASSWWDIENRFLNGLHYPNFYIVFHGSRDGKYLLWKYENHLRSQPGSHFPKISWQDFLSADSAEKLSIEHIAAQAADDDVEFALATLNSDDDEFRKEFLHCLGNLVLDSHSANASKGRKSFPGKGASYNSAPLISQNELREYVVNYTTSNEPIWDSAAIKKRSDALVAFAVEHWDPKKA
jgi:hypothetical protein